MDNKNKHVFPIGFWHVNPATDVGMQIVDDWADIGCTLTLTGWYNAARESKEDFLKILDGCLEKDIRVIVCDLRLIFNKFNNVNYEEDMRQSLTDFGNHPAVFGFYLGDEPQESQMEDAVGAVKLLRKLCPDKEPFINLLPYVPGAQKDADGSGLVFSAQDNYKQHLLDFVRKSGVKILSYDCYMQMCESAPGVLEDGALDAYYENLRIFWEVAAETGVELWFTALAVGHGMYRCPTQDDFRWQINTAVAHGVKGLFYWYLYADSYNFNYRLHPVDMLYERTDTFRWVSAENRIFQKVYGSVFCELTLEKVYHVGKVYGGFPRLFSNSGEFIKSVWLKREDNSLIISRFRRESDPGRVYYALVNNDQRNPQWAKFKFSRNAKVFEVRSGGSYLNLIPKKTLNRDDELHYWFSPGQMWVISVEENK